MSLTTQEFPFDHAETNKVLWVVLGKLVTARDGGLLSAEKELIRYTEMPSTTLWYRIKEKYGVCTRLDHRFMDLFNCIRVKLIEDPLCSEDQMDAHKKTKRASLLAKVNRMDLNKDRYVARLASARTGFDKQAAN